MIAMIADAVVPIALVLLIGHLLALIRSEDSLWRGLEWLSYWVLMPSLLVSSIVRAPELTVPWVSLLSALFGTLFLLTGLLVFGWRLGWLGRSYPQWTSLYQGVIRFNTFIALAVMAGLDANGLPNMAIAAACIIVVINVLCVSVLSAGNGPVSSLRIVKQCLKNPLILGCVMGAVGRLLPIGGAWPVQALWMLGQAALPVGVLVLGAGLKWRGFQSGSLWILLACVGQLLLKPAVFLVLATVVALPLNWVLVGLILMAVATAPSSYVLAKQLGGDAPLMAAMVAAETLLSVLTLPLVLWFASTHGWIVLG